jgi:transcriptional regulator with XRE-family HTH domain
LPAHKIGRVGLPDFLKRELNRCKQRNPRYSLRALARDLDCDHATLSQWLRGERPMSLDAEEHVFARLDLSPIERARARELDDSDLRVLAGIRTSAARTSPAVGEAAAVTIDQVNVSVAKLARLELIELRGPEWAIMEDAE